MQFTEDPPLPSLMVNKHRAQSMVRSAAVGARTKIGGNSSLGIAGGRQSEISTAFDNMEL